jgi:hypothetical protein
VGTPPTLCQVFRPFLWGLLIPFPKGKLCLLTFVLVLVKSPTPTHQIYRALRIQQRYWRNHEVGRQVGIQLCSCRLPQAPSLCFLSRPQPPGRCLGCQLPGFFDPSSFRCSPSLSPSLPPSLVFCCVLSDKPALFPAFLM